MIPAIQNWFENVTSWWDLPSFDDIFNFFPFGVFVTAIVSALGVVLALKIVHFSKLL